MMWSIGRTIAYALLCTVAFPKSSISASASDQRVHFILRNEDKNGAGQVTKLLPISRVSTIDPDVAQLRRFLDDLFISHGSEEIVPSSRQARTFGHKRIQFLLMPMMYKMGVMMTMLTVLTIISMKGLLIGAILLMLKLSTIIGKFTSGWQQSAQPLGQPIHVHVHNSLPSAHSPAYSGWMPHSGPENDGEHFYYRG